MADRIERYLGRLEAELDGRVETDRREEILVEVEGHLRESEEAYRELGEPAELANRLAVDGFDDKQLLGMKVTKNRIPEPVGLRSWLIALVVFFVFWVLLGAVIANSFEARMAMMASAAVCSAIYGWFAFGWWRTHLRTITLAVVLLSGWWMFNGRIDPQGNMLNRVVAIESQIWQDYAHVPERMAAIERNGKVDLNNAELRTRLTQLDFAPAQGMVRWGGWQLDGLYFEDSAEGSQSMKRWLFESTGLEPYPAAYAVQWEQLRRVNQSVEEANSGGRVAVWAQVMPYILLCSAKTCWLFMIYGGVAALGRKIIEILNRYIRRKRAKAHGI